MVFSMKLPLATALLLAPLVQGQQIPPECNGSPSLAGGTNYCSICPPGQYAASTTTEAFVFGNPLSCYAWSVAGICGVIPGGEMGCSFVTGQVQNDCASSCQPLANFSIETATPTALPTTSPTASPTLTPTASPTNKPTFTLDLAFCESTDNSSCGDDKFAVCIEKKGEQKSKCFKSGKTLKGDEALINCGECGAATEPAVLGPVDVPVDEPVLVEGLSVAGCFASGFTCDDEEAQVCLGKAPKGRRILKKPKTKCIEVSKSIKEDEIVLNCGECA